MGTLVGADGFRASLVPSTMLTRGAGSLGDMRAGIAISLTCRTYKGIRGRVPGCNPRLVVVRTYHRYIITRDLCPVRRAFMLAGPVRVSKT